MKKHMKRVLALTLSAMMFFSSSKVFLSQAEEQSSEVNSEATEGEIYDITPPVVNSVKMELEMVGDTPSSEDRIRITVDAYDAGVGIDRVYVGVTAPKDAAGTMLSSSVGLKYNENTGLYEVSYSRGRYPGKTYINYLAVTDLNGNVTNGVVSTDGKTSASETTALYWVDLAEISNSDEPVIVSVTTDKEGKTLKPGEKVSIRIETENDENLSENANIIIYCSNNNMSVKYKSISLGLVNGTDGKQSYQGEYTIEEDMPTGSWRISSINVSDASSNRADDSAFSSKVLFEVQNDNWDTELPVIHNISMEKVGEMLHVGDSAKITVEASDNDEIAEVSVSLRVPATIGVDCSKTIPLTRVGETNSYEGTFMVEEDTYPSEWYISGVKVEDASGNYGRFTPSFYDTLYSLEESFYVNVMNGNTFVEPTVNVRFSDFNEEGEWEEVKEMPVPRRTTLKEIQTKCNPSNFYKELEFIGWKISGDETRDESRPIIRDIYLNSYYDKAVLELYITDKEERQRIETDGFDKKKDLKKCVVFIERGTTYGLPTEIGGYKDIVWINYRLGWEDEETGLEYVKAGEEVTTTVLGENYCRFSYIGYGTPSEDSGSDVTNPSDSPDSNTSEDNTNTESNTPTGTPADTQKTPGKISGEKLEQILEKIENATAGTKIAVEMGEAIVVDKEILEKIKGKDIDIVLQMNGYNWTINGKSVKSTNLSDINLEVTRNVNLIPNVTIKKLAGSNPVEQISLSHNGDFGFTATLTMNIGKQYQGKNGNLYYYDSTGKMVFIDAGVISEDGEISLDFSHASEYAIVISDAKVVKTGDATSLGIWVLMGAMGMGFLLFTGVGIKRKVRR